MSTAAATADAVPAPKKGKKLLIVILAALLVLTIGGGAGVYLIIARKNANASHSEAKKPVEKKGPSVFAPLEPFTVNLADPSRDHYLQIGLTFEVSGTDIGDAIKSQMPLLRSRVLLILTSKSSEELATPQGKGKLAAELVALARAALAGAAAPGALNEDRGVIDVHFASFIIQ